MADSEIHFLRKSARGVFHKLDYKWGTPHQKFSLFRKPQSTPGPYTLFSVALINFSTALYVVFMEWQETTQ